MSGFRYGRYVEGPDPLASPYDTSKALDELADRVLAGSGVADAMRDLLQRGTDNLRGLADLRRLVQQRRKSLLNSGRLTGTLDKARELLARALTAEREVLANDPDGAFDQARLDALPPQPARAVRELAEYEWHSAEAGAAFDELKDLLRREVLDQQFAGLKQGLAQPSDPATRAALGAMLSDLNELLEAHAKGQDSDADFANFMAKHGQYFPDNPASVDELVDQLARRAAAAQRLLDSLSPEQREQLSDLMAQALSEMGLGDQLGRLNDNLRAMRPQLSWSGQQRMRGERPLGLGEATGALAELADLDALADELGQNYAGAGLADVDEDAVARALGRSAVDDLRRLQEIERQLERSGYLVRSHGELTFSAKAIRRIGQTALQRVFASLDARAAGDHDIREAGSAGELTGTTRAWAFGDDQPLDVVGTVRNAVRRRLMEPAGPALAADDFEVRETETRTRAAVVLLVDQSFSMVMNDTWQAAKTTAMALHALASSAFPADALAIIAFANQARHIKPHELPDLDVNDVQGTNLQHALMLAGRFLQRHPDAEPVVMIVTDGEPTAHLTRSGEAVFTWPPSSETLELTLAEVDRMTRRGVPLSFFRLGDDPRLALFLDDVARRNGGRVLAPQGDRLGDYVVSDYLHRRGARRRSA